MRIIFMGTPDFAVGTLEALLAAGHEVALAVTQPDKPKGRGKAVQVSPVKACAVSHGIEVFQPARVREDANLQYLRGFGAEIIVVAAFGQILPQTLLDMPKYGCVNVHASLLPKYRGAAPIQWAILNGDRVTGVTTMRMDAGIDTGDMILKREVPIAEDETAGSLFEKLSAVGAALCVETLERLEAGTAEFVPQDHEACTHTAMITKEMGDIDWARPAEELGRLVRGLNPWPGTYTYLDNKTFKIWRALVNPENGGETPGTVVRADKSGIYVQTGGGRLVIREVQLEGKKRMETAAFLNGYPLEAGMRLGS